VKLGIVADIHGNDVALRAVLKDADRFEVDRWWALGDLVLFGPRPAEVLELLEGLPGIGMLRGNTDRYVLTGEQPAPHATVADAAGSIDLVERYAAMAAGIAWTRGVLDQGGLLDVLIGLPAQLRLRSPSGATILGVHASPRADDGPGIDPGIADEQLRQLLGGSDAEFVIGGHTHFAADRLVGGIRALNPGSTGLPRTCGLANWLLLEDDGDELAVTHRSVPFDVEAVVGDLRRRRHPNAEFTASILAGLHQMLRIRGPARPAAVIRNDQSVLGRAGARVRLAWPPQDICRR
jgi:predicted phosphodiesterase